MHALSGDAFEPVDILFDSFFDILSDEAFEFLLRLADSTLIGAVLAAPRCGEYSMLKLRCPGPQPLRTPQQLRGVEGLSPADQLRLQDSAVLHDRAHLILLRVITHHGLAIFENPTSSMAWQEPQQQELLHRHMPYVAHVSACNVGLDVSKSWAFAASHPSILRLAQCCVHGQDAHASIAGKRDASGEYVSRSTFYGPIFCPNGACGPRRCHVWLMGADLSAMAPGSLPKRGRCASLGHPCFYIAEGLHSAIASRLQRGSKDPPVSDSELQPFLEALCDFLDVAPGPARTQLFAHRARQTISLELA